MKLRITQPGSLPVAETGRVSRTRDGGELAELYIRAQTALRSMPVKAPPFARFPQTERDETRGLAVLDTGAQKTRLRYEDLICR